MRIVKQKDIEILLQTNKRLNFKIELLTRDYKILDCIEGNILSDNISISADSDIRRTYNCTMLVKNANITLGKSIVWFDKLIRPYIGIIHERTNETVWYKLGVFLYTDINHEYDATTNTLSLTCLDLMSLLNDQRNGQLEGYLRTIKAGADARNVIINILDEIDIKEYSVSFNINNQTYNTFEIPYDLKYNAGMNAYQIIKDIVALYPGNQMYFDVDGIFRIEPIQISEYEQYILNDEILQKIVISETTTTSLSNIANHIQIWGRENEADYYSTEVTCEDNIYKANVIAYNIDPITKDKQETDYDEYMNYDCIALKLPTTNQCPQFININNLGNVLIVDELHNPVQANIIEPTDSVFRYRKDVNEFLYLGSYQCFSEVYDFNGEYGINKIGERLKVLSGDEYSKIYTNNLCFIRAKMELVNYTHKQVTLKLNTVSIPFLDVNDLILYTPQGEETGLYIINSINCNYAEYTMEIELNKYYPQQL